MKVNASNFGYVEGKCGDDDDDDDGDDDGE